MKTGKTELSAIPRTIWALGLVSLFMDVASEMIHSLLPVFLVSVLGVGVTAVGLIEGTAEAVALMSRLVSGTLSDRLGKRKRLALIGYGLGTVTKPLFAMASGVGLIFTARSLDRLGKGIRGAPRDALVADVTAPHIRGAAYGLRQSLDTVGAFAGPVLAVALMMVTGGAIRAVFWAAVIPGVIAVAILALAVKEPDVRRLPVRRHRLKAGHLSDLKPAFWLVAAFGAVFTLARFSEAFLLLRAADTGMPAGWVPLIMIVMNLTYALSAYPAGRLSDRWGRTGLMAAGLVVLAASDLMLARAHHPWQVAAGAAAWGLHMGLTQGLLSALVADTATADLRATAFGVFSFFSGVSVFTGSLAAGWLWDRFGAPVTFYTGAVLAVGALIGFLTAHQHPAGTADTPR